MNRNLVLLGTVAAFGFAAVVAGAGDSTRAVACDETAKAASVSSCCATKGEAKSVSASAASIRGAKAKNVSSCSKGAAVTASMNSGCARSAAIQTAAAGCDKSAATAAVAAGCDKSANTAVAAGSSCAKGTAVAAGSSCEKGTAVAAGGDACCKSGTATAAGSKEACKEVCDETKTATAIKAGTVNELPYRENKRVVLTGAYVCGHCTLHVTDGCSPMFKTADGKVYPLIKNNESSSLRKADTGKGVEIASSVKKIDGIKYLEVKSYKAL